MRLQLCFLLATLLAAQDPLPVTDLKLELRTDLGSDPAEHLVLTPHGCWDGLLFMSAAQPKPSPQRRMAEATVEVWELLPPTSPRREALTLFLGSLRERLSKAWLAPPPKLQALELNDIMANDPSTPQKLDLTKVKSMQDHFNRMPPSGSPVKSALD